MLEGVVSLTSTRPPEPVHQLLENLTVVICAFGIVLDAIRRFLISTKISNSRKEKLNFFTCISHPSTPLLFLR